jgi:hypothetical protein
MPMNEDDRLFLIVRFLAAAGGMLGGSMSGTILIVLLMVFTGSTFGLANIWPGTVIGAIVGAVLGFLFPRIGKALIGFFARVQ